MQRQFCLNICKIECIFLTYFMMPTSSLFSKLVNDAISYSVVIGSIVGDNSFLMPPPKNHHFSFTHCQSTYKSLHHFLYSPCHYPYGYSPILHIEYERISWRSHRSTSHSKENGYGAKPRLGTKCRQVSVQRF